MLEARTYSIADLEKLTGFDRRTIVYYIQQGLLPRAGRRGPNTRYPEECLLRLRFIRALKDHQDQGQCGTVTLRDIHGMITALDAPTLMGMLERGPSRGGRRTAPCRSSPAPNPGDHPFAGNASTPGGRGSRTDCSTRPTGGATSHPAGA